MTLVCFTSQKGSPGSTATSLGVAAAMKVSDGRQKLLIEADSTGGTLAIRYRLPVEPGLLTLAAAVRSGIQAEDLWGHAQELPGGLRVIVCPDGPEQVHAALAASGAALGRFLNQLPDVHVICDVGRLAPDSPALAFVAESSAVLMVARPSAEQLQPAARRMLSLQSQVRNVGWVLIGEKPYGPSEVESTYNFPVVGLMADDPKSVAHLEQGLMSRKIRRSPFVRSSVTLARTLSDWLAPISGPATPSAPAEVVEPTQPEPAQPEFDPDLSSVRRPVVTEPSSGSAPPSPPRQQAEQRAAQSRARRRSADPLPPMASTSTPTPTRVPVSESAVEIEVAALPDPEQNKPVPDLSAPDTGTKLPEGHDEWPAPKLDGPIEAPAPPLPDLSRAGSLPPVSQPGFGSTNVSHPELLDQPTQPVRNEPPWPDPTSISSQGTGQDVWADEWDGSEFTTTADLQAVFTPGRQGVVPPSSKEKARPNRRGRELPPLPPPSARRDGSEHADKPPNAFPHEEPTNGEYS